MSSRIFAFFGVGIVAVALVLGIFQLDSPQTVRDMRMDRIRSERLWSAIQATNEYTARTGNLPTSTDSFRRFPEFDYSRTQFLDPQTGDSFAYFSTTSTFSWCAVFSRESVQNVHNIPSFPPDFYGRLFFHGVGYTCFETSKPTAVFDMSEDMKKAEQTDP
jgi:hypothetical protein